MKANNNPQIFLSAKEYNKAAKWHSSNCLAFAFSKTSNYLPDFDLLSLDQINLLKNGKEIEQVDICEAFIKKAKEFGYDVRQITDISKADGKVLFLVFGWYTDYIQNIGDYDYFFHVIRRNEDGTFEHKPDWYSLAKTMSINELNKWLSLDMERFYFVLG